MAEFHIPVPTPGYIDILKADEERNRELERLRSINEILAAENAELRKQVENATPKA